MHRVGFHACAVVCAFLLACSAGGLDGSTSVSNDHDNGSGGTAAGGSGSGDGSGGQTSDTPDAGSLNLTYTDAAPPGQPQSNYDAELWYASGDLLVYIEIDPSDGSVARVEQSQLPLPKDRFNGQNAITMLADGSLLGARLAANSEFYLIPDPPRDGSPAQVTELGSMDIDIEGLYTDCEDRIYAMDTGTNETDSNGNRLLIYTGDVLQGDFTFEPVSDLSQADVADIDDLGPGLDADGAITDNPGLAIDTGDIYDFNYETGTGTFAATGGSFGIHVLGGSLFSDGQARIYVLSSRADLYEVDPATWALSDSLMTGPKPAWGRYDAHSGLAGPLTACETGFTHTIK